MLKRFYPPVVKIPTSETDGLKKSEKKVLAIIKKKPGLTQQKIVEQTGLDQGNVSRTLNQLIEKDMTQKGPEGLSGWIRTTWMPYTHRVPEHERNAFVDEIVENYLKEYPLDAEGWAHVQMVRLEVEAKK